MAACELVQGLRGHVDTVWPRDRPGVPVQPDLREESLVLQRLEYAVPGSVGEVDIANRSVVEGQPQAIRGDHLDCRHVEQGIHSNPMVRI